jgi:hypothetical protein
MAFDWTLIKTDSLAEDNDRQYWGYNLVGGAGMILNVRLRMAIPGALASLSPTKGIEKELFLPGDNVSTLNPSWTQLKDEDLGNRLHRYEHAYQTPGGNVLLRNLTIAQIYINKVLRTFYVDESYTVIQNATISGTDIVGGGGNAFRNALDFSDDLDDSSIHPTWTVNTPVGSINETTKLNITVPNGVTADWTGAVQSSPNVHFQLTHPGNVFFYVHCTLLSALDHQGASVTIYFTADKQWYAHMQLRRTLGQWQLYSIIRGAPMGTGYPLNSNPLNIGQSSAWIGILRMGDWIDTCYSLNTVNNEPGINDWTEHGISTNNFSHFGNDVALAGYNFGSLPGTQIEFRKFRLLYM